MSKVKTLCSFGNCENCLLPRKTLRVHAGQKFTESGELPKGLFFLKRGLLKLVTTGNSGNSVTLRVAKSGDIFGYRSLLSNVPYYYDIVVLSDSEVCFFDQTYIEKKLNFDPSFCREIIQQLCSDLQEADLRLSRQVGDRVSERVFFAFRKLTNLAPNFHWTKKEISQFAGTTVESTFRTLSTSKERENLAETTSDP